MASLLFINISFAANTGKVIVETAKLREQANTDSKVLELASQGEEVEILNEEDQWYKVKYKQVIGYIRKDLIELDNKEAASTKNKNEQIEKFKKDKSCKVFITTIGAGGVGLNLQEAHTEIFFSVGWTYAGFTQAIDLLITLMHYAKYMF